MPPKYENLLRKYYDSVHNASELGQRTHSNSFDQQNFKARQQFQKAPNTTQINYFNDQRATVQIICRICRCDGQKRPIHR